MATEAPPAAKRPASSRARRPTSGPMRRRQALAAWGFASPFVVLFVVFVAAPVIVSFAMSFTDLKRRDVGNPLAVNPVGIDNYVNLFSDERFLQSVLNTVYFVGVGVPLTMALALAAAVALNRGVTRLRTVFRVGYYLPVVSSIVAVGVVWKYLYDYQGGLFNQLLGAVGIDGPDWLHEPALAMPSLILMAIWRNVGALMVIFLAGLQAIPLSLYEAADVDGATGWEKFRFVTVPMLRPTLLFGAVITGIGYLQLFEEPFVMTEGGPLNKTLSVSFEIFKEFGAGNYSYAAAMSYALFLAIVGLTLVQFKLLGQRPD